MAGCLSISITISLNKEKGGLVITMSHAFKYSIHSVLLKSPSPSNFLITFDLCRKSVISASAISPLKSLNFPTSKTYPVALFKVSCLSLNKSNCVSIIVEAQ